MRIEYLEYFLHYAELKSISKAAEDLHMSQQGLSRILHIIKNEFNVNLVVRHGNSTSLTPAGKELQKYAQEIVSSYQKLERQMAKISNGSGGAKGQHVLIFMTVNTLHNIYPCISDAVTRAFPHCTISVIELDQNEVVPKVLANSASNELFFISTPAPLLETYATFEDFSFRPLINTSLTAIVGKNSSLADRKSFSWEEMDKIGLAFRRDEGMLALLDLKHLEGYPNKAMLWTSDTKTLDLALETMDVITFSTTFLKRYDNSDKYAYIPIEETFETPVGFAGHKYAELSKEAEEIRGFIENYVMLAYPDSLYDNSNVIANRWVPPHAANPSIPASSVA